MDVYLKELSENDGKRIYDMLQGVKKDDNGFMNDVKDMSYDNFKSWLIENINYSKALNLPDNWVPQTTFILYVDQKPVGIGRIRHYLNENLKKDGGHIGYAISFPYRGNGYGNIILKLLVKECINMKINEIHLGANKDNEKSNKIIVYNGGVLCRETETKNYYIINIEKK
jgi:predicted acetyltransferase